VYKRKSILSIFLIALIVLCISLSACDGRKISLVVIDGEFSVHFLDVGQGDSILINFPNGKNMLIDTGDTNDAVADYIIDCVKKTDENKIDYLVLTHTDTDHIGNALRIIDAFDVEKAFVPKADKLALFPTFSTVLDKLNNQNTQITIRSHSKTKTDFISFPAKITPIL
jgi:beta-lactamase superfamily II metal-dependent hydrolase